MELTGKILIAMGYTPGKWFRPVLDYVNAQEDMSMAELKAYVDSQVPQTIAPHETAVPYFKNIRAEEDIESANVTSVFETSSYAFCRCLLLSDDDFIWRY